MPRYKVKCSYMYSDTVLVEAENKEDAILVANRESEPAYEYFCDAEAEETEIDED